MSTKKKARTRYILLVGIMILLLAIVFSVFHSLYDEYCGTLLDQKLKHLLLISRANASVMQTQYEKLFNDCRLWIEDRRVAELMEEEPSPVELEADLDRFLSRNTEGHYLYACLVAADGQILCSQDRGLNNLARLPVSPSEFALRLGSDSLGFWLTNQTYCLLYTKRIYADNRLVGAFVGLLDFSSIANQLFRHVRISEGGYLSVMDEKGVYLLHPNAEMLGHSIYSYITDADDAQNLSSFFKLKERGKAILAWTDDAHEDEQYLLTFCHANLGISRFIVSAALPYSEVISAVRETVSRAVFTFFLFAALLMLLLGVLFFKIRESALMRAEQRHLAQMNDMLLDIQNRQTQLHQKENLQALGLFTSNFAHEFSNLLTPILANCELLMLLHHNEPELYASLEDIYSSATASRALSKQLLSFARSSKASDVALMPIDVNSTLRSLIKTLHLQANGHINTVYDLSETPLYIMGNPSMLHQALSNLCINACQAMENGGTLTIHCKKVGANALLDIPEFSASMPFIGDGIVLSIKDTGCGMDDKTVRQIFDPFYTQKKNGTGLGLMIVRNIINQHNGLITVSSRVGEGSCFTIILPATDGRVFSGERSSQKNLMVVHAVHSPNLSMYHRLQADGYQIFLFTDPLEAIKAFSLEPEHYSLLITEYNLESFNGISLCRTFHRMDSLLPIILMTQLVHSSQMIFDPDSAPDVVLLNSAGYTALSESLMVLLFPKEGGNA